eukprot:892829-Pyramimonas_sp.AAC.2
MRPFTRAVLDSVWLNRIKGVCGTCRGRRAWDKPGQTIMSSTALLGKLNDEVECDLMFYKQGHRVFYIIERSIRYGAGTEIPGKTMASILDAHHQCQMQVGPAEALYSDGGGALNNDAAKAVLMARGIELGIRARAQRATTIPARSGIL